MAEHTAQQRAAVRLFVERFNGALAYMALLRADEGSAAEAEAQVRVRVRVR